MAFSASLSCLALLLVSFVFIFDSAEVKQLPGFYQHFICCRLEVSHTPGFLLLLLFMEGWSEVNRFYSGSLLRAWVLERFYPLWLSCLSLLILSSIALKLSSFLGVISILSAVGWNYPTCQAFFYYYYFRRVEVKLNFCSLEVFPKPGLFCLFTLSGLAFFLFIFYSAKVTSFLDFISILSAVAWNYPTCQAFFLLLLFLECWS